MANIPAPPSGQARPPRAETRRRLLAAGWRQLREHGIHGASIAEICADAGYTRGAFYSNFTGKEDLFLTLYAAEIESRADRLRHGFDTMRRRSSVLHSVSTQWMVRAVLEAFTEGDDSDDRHWFILTGEVQAAALRNRDLGARLAGLQNRMADLLAAVISQELAELGLVLNMPVTEAIAIIGGLYETTLKNAMLDAGYEEARRHTLDLIPRVLEPLVRVQEDLAPGAVAALRTSRILPGSARADPR